MCPSVSVLTSKSAERNTFMRISSTDDICDGTSVTATILSLDAEKNLSRLVRFQIRRAQFSTIRICELDLEESVVTNEDDMIVSCRIEFMSGVFRDDWISTGMEPGRTKENEHRVSPRDVRIMLTATCTNPCKAAHREPCQVPIEH